jgi:hypothetical protein
MPTADRTALSARAVAARAARLQAAAARARGRRVQLMPPARWKSARVAAHSPATDWSAMAAPCAWASVRHGSVAAPLARPWQHRRRARLGDLQADLLAVLRQVPWSHWSAWAASGRRRAFAVTLLCAACGVMALRPGLRAAPSPSLPEAPDAALAARPPQPLARLASAAQSLAAPAVSADTSSSTDAPTARLADVSTMDLMMPIAEPDLDIASPRSLWAQVGRQAGVDPLLLYSIALVESRSLHPDGQVAPTPWLFRVNDHLVLGDRHHVQLQMALASQFGSAVQDVGIMQVYYPMHRDAVRDPLALLDPRTNISVAAQILREGMRETRDPVLGVGYYHSHTPALARDYGIAVMTVYQRLKELYRPGKTRRIVAR